MSATTTTTRCSTDLRCALQRRRDKVDQALLVRRSVFGPRRCDATYAKTKVGAVVVACLRGGGGCCRRESDDARVPYVHPARNKLSQARVSEEEAKRRAQDESDGHLQYARANGGVGGDVGCAAPTRRRTNTIATPPDARRRRTRGRLRWMFGVARDKCVEHLAAKATLRVW